MKDNVGTRTLPLTQDRMAEATKQRRWGADGKKRGWGTNLEKKSGAAKGLGQKRPKGEGY